MRPVAMEVIIANDGGCAQPNDAGYARMGDAIDLIFSRDKEPSADVPVLVAQLQHGVGLAVYRAFFQPFQRGLKQQQMISFPHGVVG